MFNRSGAVFFLQACMAGGLFAPAAAAQSALRGVVRGDSGAAIPNAEVFVEKLRLTTRASDAGHFLLGPVPKGRHTVTVRAIGRQPVAMDVLFSGSDTLTADFALGRAVHRLPGVTVDDPGPGIVSAKMVGFEERRHKGFGRFLTREQLAAKEHSPLSEVLRGTGITPLARPGECGGGTAAASRRGGSLGMPVGCRMPPACYMAVYLDGLRFWTPDDRDPAPNIDQFTVFTMQGIEVYRGVSEVPIAFASRGASCGAVLLWTRAGEA